MFVACVCASVCLSACRRASLETKKFLTKTREKELTEREEENDIEQENEKPLCGWAQCLNPSVTQKQNQCKKKAAFGDKRENKK